MSNFQVLESYVQLRRMVALLRAAEAKNIEFGHNQISVLYRLSLSSATMGELADHTSSDKASMTRTVAVLEKSGLVKRISSESDRRIINIELTAKGRIQAKKAQEIRNNIGKKLEQSLTLTERKQFTSLIEKMIDNLQPQKID